MCGTSVSRYRCSTCPHSLTYMEAVSRKENGVMLQFGKRYCTGGKRYRKFKSSDPKAYPPAWCPKLKHPAEFRVYAFKNTDAWYFHTLLGKEGTPSSFDCAVRISGTTELTAREFYELADEKGACELLGLDVYYHEIVEIDDGLKPHFFHLRPGGLEVLPYWNAESARRNKYEGGSDAT